VWNDWYCSDGVVMWLCGMIDGNRPITVTGQSEHAQNTKEKVKQYRYRPGIAQMVTGS
jgi:hypothetical protein